MGCWMRARMGGVALLIAALMMGSAWAQNAAPLAEGQGQTWQLDSLSADWWRKLPAGSGELKTSLTLLMDQMTGQRSSLPVELQEQSANAWESLQANVQALISLRARPLPAMPKAAVFADHYDLVRWQEALVEQRRQQAELEAAQQSLEQTQAQRDAIAHEADEATAAYLSQPQSGDQRLLQTLLVVEKRLAWLLTEESLRLHKGQVQVQEALLAQAQAAWQLASERLRVTPDMLAEVAAQAEKDRAQLDKAQDALRSAQADAVVVWGDDSLSHARKRAQRARSLQAGVHHAVWQSRVAWREAVQQYVGWRLAPDAVDVEQQLRLPMRSRTALLTQLNEERKRWRSQLEVLRDQVQSSLLALAENPPEDLAARQQGQMRSYYQQALTAINTSLAELKALHAQLDDIATLQRLQQAGLAAQEGIWLTHWHDLRDALLMGWQQVKEWMETSLFKVGDTPVTLMGLLRVLVFLTLAWWLSYWLRQGLQRVARHNDKIAPHTAYTLGRLIHYGVMLVGTVVALSSIGIDFSNVAWIAGALSVGIGFGLQSVVNNFVSGLIVMFEKTLKVGDFIELPSGVSGVVKEIRLRSTLITTGDNLDIVVPNAEFMSGRVVNWTLSDLYRRVHVPFAVALDTDKRQVVKAVLEAAQEVPYTLQDPGREPQVVLNSLDGKMAFELLVWIKQGSVKHAYGVKASYLWQIESALKGRGIVLV